MEKVIDIEDRIPTLKQRRKKAYKSQIHCPNITFLFSASCTPLFSISLQ